MSETLCARVMQFGQRENVAYHALIVREADKLLCFAANRGACEQMTMQTDTGEESPQWFAANPRAFVKKCMPAVLEKTDGPATIRLAFVDGESGWDHTALLKEWAEAQTKRPQSSMRSQIILEAFILSPAEALILQAQETWTNTNIGRDSVSIRPDISNASQHPSSPFSALDMQQSRVELIAMQDIPADFDRIVWKASGSGGGSEACLILRDAGSFLTTGEAAAQMQAKPRMADLLDVYGQLRAAQGITTTVPMIGFEPNWLWAESHLEREIFLEDVCMPSKMLPGLRVRRYQNGPAARTEQVSARLISAIRHCLGTATAGLLLFDLTEDVICTLTGQTRIRLSLADVCRILFVMEPNSIPP